MSGVLFGLFVILCLDFGSAISEKNNTSVSDDPAEKAITDCLDSETIYACFAKNAAIIIDRGINMDFEIYDGIKLVRNDKKINFRKGKSQDVFQRLVKSISNFINSHNLSINLTESEARRGPGGGGGLFNFNSKAVRREKRYSKYAFMVLLGIFGLTGPLFMKVLGIIAAQALMAAKAALIIVGSVALKKLFEKKEEKPTVKVATIPLHDGDEDHHDRLGYFYGYSPYGYYYDTKEENLPYFGYVTERNVNKQEFAPIVYGKRYMSNTVTKNR